MLVARGYLRRRGGVMRMVVVILPYGPEINAGIHWIFDTLDWDDVLARFEEDGSRYFCERGHVFRTHLPLCLRASSVGHIAMSTCFRAAWRSPRVAAECIVDVSLAAAPRRRRRRLDHLWYTLQPDACSRAAPRGRA